MKQRKIIANDVSLKITVIVCMAAVTIGGLFALALLPNELALAAGLMVGNFLTAAGLLFPRLAPTAPAPVTQSAPPVNTE